MRRAGASRSGWRSGSSSPYAALYFVTSKPFNLIPGSHFLVEKYVACWYAAVVWVGKNVLRTSYDIYLLDSGSGIGNTAFGSILFLCYLVAAVVVAKGFHWIFDPGRDSEP